MTTRFILAVVLSSAWSARAQDSALDNLPTLKKFESHRITSADSSGKNDDWRVLPPGQTLVLADIQGPGCITLGPLPSVA